VRGVAVIESLASYQHCVARIAETWSAFQDQRRKRLVQQQRHGIAAERVAENILEDLFTQVLDWSISDVNNQVGYADLTLTRLGVKELIIETKRPGALAWHRHAVDAALEQALGYAHEQNVRHIAVSDGYMLYAADVAPGGLTDRVFCTLEDRQPVTDLWWLSMHGIYRPREARPGTAARLLPDAARPGAPSATAPPPRLLHPKYHLPSWCFAYVGNATKTSTWKLPYLKVDGRRREAPAEGSPVDPQQLPRGHREHRPRSCDTRRAGQARRRRTPGREDAGADRIARARLRGAGDGAGATRPARRDRRLLSRPPGGHA